MAHCPSSYTCPFFRAVDASLVKRIRFASAYPYCNGGKSVECAIQVELLQGREPAVDLLPDGSRGDYRGETASHAGTSPGGSNGDRFLVIEDSPIFAGFAANAIRFKFPDAEIVECHSFAEAERALLAGRFKLVVSGFGLDNGKTAHDVRRLSDAPMVLLTGRPDRDVSSLHPVHLVPKGAGGEGMRGAIGALLGA